MQLHDADSLIATMLKIPTLLVLAFTACTSALPAAETGHTIADISIVKSCICGNTTGLFCGERASSRDALISGNCKATGLYFCSQWAVNNTGVADLVQAPCWTGKCYQYDNHKNNTGIDSCSPVKAIREELAPFVDEIPVVKAVSALSTAASNQTAEAKKREAVSTTDCTCGNYTGNFCGQRTSAIEHDYAPLAGNCSANSLYYCSPSAVNTTGPADVVQEPCVCQLGSLSSTPTCAPFAHLFARCFHLLYLQFPEERFLLLFSLYLSSNRRLLTPHLRSGPTHATRPPRLAMTHVRLLDRRLLRGSSVRFNLILQTAFALPLAFSAVRQRSSHPDEDGRI